MGHERTGPRHRTAAIQWPELIDYLHKEQAGDAAPWGIRQKQTGVDRVSIGGSLAANIHGRGLTMRPFVADVDYNEGLAGKPAPYSAVEEA